jgi:hypothetical protein
VALSDRFGQLGLVAHRVVSTRSARSDANVVPQVPPPTTAIFMETSPSGPDQRSPVDGEDLACRGNNFDYRLLYCSDPGAGVVVGGACRNRRI